MNNIEKNALRIAELLGYDEWRLKNIQDVLICRYTAYDYLMPIVFECTMNSGKYAIEFLITGISIGEYVNCTYTEIDGFGYTTEPEFIEAIQLAVIKYLELKK